MIDNNGDPGQTEVGHRFSILTEIPGITSTSFVYCAKEGKVKAKRGTLETEGQGSLITAFSGECNKKAKRLRAGGFDQPNASISPPGYYDPIIGSLKIGAQWWVTAVHNGPASTQLQSYAYCN